MSVIAWPSTETCEVISHTPSAGVAPLHRAERFCACAGSQECGSAESAGGLCVCGGGNASSASDAVSTRRAQTYALTKVGVIDVSRAAALGVVLCSDTMTIIAAARIKRKRGAGDGAPLCLGCGRLVRVRTDLSTPRWFYERVERTAAFGG